LGVNPVGRLMALRRESKPYGKSVPPKSKANTLV
jgi:hypothetical protein